jgi:acetolactate synthase-1/3 small subunit
MSTVMRHIISILLQNEAGALSRVAALFSTRGYNIESLSVAPTEDAEISRLTLVSSGSDEAIDQISQQLLKLVDVVNIADMTLDDHIERELLLVKLKVSVDAGSNLSDIIQAAGARVLDDCPETFTLEITGANKKVDDFITKIADYSEIISVVRSGAMAIARGHTVLSANF